ncbi:MAG: hypothetical protein ACYTGB_11520 [Planctomycetota bacterium]
MRSHGPCSGSSKVTPAARWDMTARLVMAVLYLPFIEPSSSCWVRIHSSALRMARSRGCSRVSISSTCWSLSSPSAARAASPAQTASSAQAAAPASRRQHWMPGLRVTFISPAPPAS